MAFEPGRGRTAVPVRTALAGTAVAVGAVAAALVFAASLLGLVATPARYGQNWDAKLDAGYADIPASYGARLLAGVPGVAGYAAGNNGELSVNGVSVPAIGVDQVRGEGPAGGYLTLLSGRPPTGPGQIALGTRTLRALGKPSAQTVRVQVTWRGGVAGPSVTRTMRITGTAVFPAFGLPSLASTDLGSGAVVATSLLSGITEDTGCTGRQTCYNFLLLRLRPGASLDGVATTLLARAARGRVPARPVHGDSRPAAGWHHGTTRASGTPRSRSARCSPCSRVGTLAHVLVSRVRAPPAGPRGAQGARAHPAPGAGVVAWNATALAAAALLVGVPLGVVAGRWAWAVFAGAAGVATSATVDVPLMLLVIPATVVLANLIAAWPGRAAAGCAAACCARSEAGPRAVNSADHGPRLVPPHPGAGEMTPSLPAGPRGEMPVMATVWLWLRADVRRRWRALVGLALLLGLVGGVVLTAAAGARRTDTAYPRLLSWANAARSR